jgi:tight adherence protein C
MGPLIIVGVLVLIIAIGMVFVTQRTNTGEDPLEKRLIEYGDRPEPVTLADAELSLSFRDRILMPVFKWFSDIVIRFTPEQQIETVRQQIDMAGKTQTMDARTFFTQRLVLTIGLSGVALFVSSRGIGGNPLIVAVIAAAIGYILPGMQLKSAITRRQQGIIRDLPDALDLMTICVEAGLTFDMAMGKVYEKWENDLALAFGRVLAEIQLGKARREALRDMSNRMDVPDVTSFIAAVIQADQLGVSISKILRVQSDQMRVKRRQRAEEKAHQAPIKMMIPMVLLIFPSIWIVLLGPSIIIIKNSASLGAVTK